MATLKRSLVLLLSLVLLAGQAHAELEKQLLKKQPLPKAPLDVAFSQADGRVFVLLEGGEVQILSVDGQPLDTFRVGSSITGMAISPDGQRLFLIGSKDRELQVIELSEVHSLPVGSSAVKGALNAPVTITVFDDFQCPYCARLVPVLEQVLAIYTGRVRLVFKHFPLSMHAHAGPAAVASIAARNQGKFWEMHDLLFANYNTLDEAKIRELAKAAGLDLSRFDRDIQNPALAQEVAADMQLGTQVGIRGTPTVFVNGKLVKDRSLEGFRTMIDGELQKKK